VTLDEIVYWTLWAFCVALFLVLYLRVHWRDWGMVGMTGVMFAAVVLLSRTLLRHYGHTMYVDELMVLWRVMLMISAPMAFLGFGFSMKRDPVPLSQIARRLMVLVTLIVVILLVIDLIVRGT
jgi:hypothetical protein